MALSERMDAWKALVDARLDQLLPGTDRRPEELHAAMRYSCLAPGKRLRPVLCMLCAEAAGGDPLQAALDAGAAIEMVHAFSLIHDDLPAIDDDDLRRGRPTCHKAFGEAIAILAGDALFALAFETLAGARAEPSRVVRCLRELSSAAGSDGLVGGEVVDVLAEGTRPTEELLEYIHTHKTGSLIAAACAIGAELGGADSELVHRLRRYGACVGLAFQIADDILNEVATPEQLGKAVGSDRQHGKATYPALYGLDGARKAACAAADEAVWCLPQNLPNRALLEEMAAFSICRTH